MGYVHYSTGYPVACSACGKDISATTARLWDPESKKVYHPGCEPIPTADVVAADRTDVEEMADIFNTIQDLTAMQGPDRFEACSRMAIRVWLGRRKR